MNIIFLGPPGSGKGTQAKLLRTKLKVPSISTGDILRGECRQGTSLGLQVEGYLKSGQLVPDHLVIEIIKRRLHEKDCGTGYILDGFPRTLVQAEALNSLMQERGGQVDAVLNFDVGETELIRRLSGRRICEECGSSFHLEFAPPQDEGVCDQCGGQLSQREDDKEGTIRQRFSVYLHETSPLIQFYRELGVLKNIEGNGGTQEILNRIFKELVVE